MMDQLDPNMYKKKNGKKVYLGTPFMSISIPNCHKLLVRIVQHPFKRKLPRVGKSRKFLANSN
jgi:hypothetical protein